LKNSEGDWLTSWKYLSKVRVEYFKSIFKEEHRAIIAEVVKMATYFPKFVLEEDNLNLGVEATKGEIHRVFHSF
jgi:hypothetical protein